MAISQVREVARADMNDEFGVTCWQDQEQLDFTPDEAREYAREIVAAADQADAIRRADDVGEQKPTALIVDPDTGRTVL